ncbi:hypothetical protein [Bacillus cihuensis]|uniref:hypothetical protein n=1 Tax=Bacillus cihuensis TaxID=1208599 RepID=UPI00041FC955|nr:hypothetical protein [Bacillus cihuensis]
MTYQVQLLKGLLQPRTNRYQLEQAEGITRFGSRLVILYVCSALIFLLGANFGIGSESMSKEITKLGESEYETGKLLVIAGKLVASILYPTFYVLVTAVVFWAVLDIPFKKVAVVQMIAFVLHLLEKVVYLPFLLLMNLNQSANPFSLGVISQYSISNEYFIHFFGEISIFQLAIICVNYFYLQKLTDKNKYIPLILICVFYLASYFVAAFLAYIDVRVFL